MLSLGIAVGVHAAVIGLAAWSLVFSGERGDAVLGGVLVEEVEDRANDVEIVRSVPVQPPLPEIELPPAPVDPPPELRPDRVDPWSELVDFGPVDPSVAGNPFAMPERAVAEASAEPEPGRVERSRTVETAPVAAEVIPPRCRSAPPPRYPAVAQRRGLEGVAVIAGLVLEDGAVERLRVAKSSGSPILDEAAVAAVRKWRFDPARRGGVPIAFPIEVPIEFSLN